MNISITRWLAAALVAPLPVGLGTSADRFVSEIYKESR
jgi:hypothetical protein